MRLKFHRSSYCLATFLLFISFAGTTLAQPAERREAFVDSVLATLTLEQKLGQLAQFLSLIHI